MPLDPPKPGETHEEWISYCMPIEIGAGKENDQAYAICESKWEESKMSAQDMFILELKKYVKWNSR
jgi:hypothetical protein